MKIPIHLEHFRDHYPLCWTMDMDSQDFTATAIEDDVSGRNRGLRMSTSSRPRAPTTARS